MICFTAEGSAVAQHRIANRVRTRIARPIMDRILKSTERNGAATINAIVAEIGKA
jgi:hypothetical protein